MLATISRDKALRELAIEYMAVRAMLDELTDEEMTRPNTIEYGLYSGQELSFKDLLAHLTTYEVLTLEAIDAWKRGKKHPSIDEMRSPPDQYRIHHAGIEDRRHLSLEDMVDQSISTQSTLTATLTQLSDRDWHTSAPFATATPLNLGGVIEIILVAPPRPPYRHLPVHIPDTTAYIRKLRG
ncbi:MAG: DinB family protein [Chloroflexota bacterium]